MKDNYVIVSAVRTPIGRFGGSLKDINSGKLASFAITEAIKRAGIKPEQVDEVIMGEVRQTSESSNVARVAALRSGIPIEKPAFTVNRLCASGMQAITSAVQQIAFNQAEIIVAGGTENLSRAPFYLYDARFGEGVPKLIDSNLLNGQQPTETYGNDLGMGITAENVAEKYKITREEQDQFAVLSQEKTKNAIEEGKFEKEIVPIEIKRKKDRFLFKQDEHPRLDTKISSLEKLKPAFKEAGTVTAGNTCGRNDGATAIVIMKEQKANELGLKPIVRIVDWATSGVDPRFMGIGPVPAIKLLLEKTGLKKEEIDLFELNEAFAAQALAVIKETGIDINKVNVNGGAIALGHPLGATGARITTTLIHELIRRQGRYGIATLCVGGGQGIALLVERI
ncbi:thiolase family protein [Sporosarcina sp. P17b]|uniref:thiolase family protein n=1 Tax=Sporosarcina sp. P17b TaxID=2048260 RepID=UPI000C16C620|nr:thiolase family protein [Sporosarcina sp. P17b]PIC72869.1 acetyl-CoA C-acyltransferase [Sporosarcina sp. P17b]